MGVRLSEWFLANKYQHMRSFLEPSWGHEVIDDRLRARLQRRLRTAVRLIKVRFGLFVIVYAGVLGTAGATLLNWIAERFGAGLFAFASTAFATIVAVASLLAILAGIGILLINRTLSLLDADVYMLSMEVVARVVQAGGPVPSEAYVRRRPKTKG